jgi:hypothetical protein
MAISVSERDRTDCPAVSSVPIHLAVSFDAYEGLVDPFEILFNGFGDLASSHRLDGK